MEPRTNPADETGHMHVSPWQVFVVRAEDPLDDDTIGPIRALRDGGIDASGLRVLQLRALPAAAVQPALAVAHGARRWLFSSPAAVRHLKCIDARLGATLFAVDGALHQAARRGRVFAPGPGTAAALADLGVEPVQLPAARFDSEGLLALPALAAPLDGVIAIVGAPGGRGLLQQVLADRGATILSLHVYRREPALPSASERAALHDAAHPLLLATSLAALRRLPLALPRQLFARLAADAPLVVASERIAAAARAAGFRHCHVAGSAMASDLVTAIRRLGGASDADPQAIRLA